MRKSKIKHLLAPKQTLLPHLSLLYWRWQSSYVSKLIVSLGQSLHSIYYSFWMSVFRNDFVLKRCLDELKDIEIFKLSLTSTHNWYKTTILTIPKRCERERIPNNNTICHIQNILQKYFVNIYLLIENIVHVFTRFKRWDINVFKFYQSHKN